jgi:hypothetical protein
MTDTTLLCWREAMRVCMGTAETRRLAEHLARLPEMERTMLLEGIDSDGLRAAVNSVLRRRQEQLALV